MNYYLLKRLLLLFILKIPVLAITFDEAKIKADEKGGDSLSFEECKIIGSKFSNFDANGKPHIDGGFHCAYISKIFNDKKQAKIDLAKAKMDLEKKKENDNQKIKFAEFDKIKNEGRIYATLVMDTTENYNKDSLNTLKNNDFKIAGLNLSYNTNKANLIERITLNSPVTYIGLFGIIPQEQWSLDKIKTYLNYIEEKYVKVDYKREVKELDLSLVRNTILKYHNNRKEISQADYNIDYSNAHAIKNLKETYSFENKGDQIIVTIQTCLDGMQNSNAELLLIDIYQNSITIEHVSKTLIEKEKAKELEKEKKNNEIMQQEKREINKL